MDILESIKQRQINGVQDRHPDIVWLIAEVEQLNQRHDFDATRLRVLARVAGCADGIPDDATAVACAGTVMGMIRHNVEQIVAERDRYKAALEEILLLVRSIDQRQACNQAVCP